MSETGDEMVSPLMEGFSLKELVLSLLLSLKLYIRFFAINAIAIFALVNYPFMRIHVAALKGTIMHTVYERIEVSKAQKAREQKGLGTGVTAKKREKTRFGPGSKAAAKKEEAEDLVTKVNNAKEIVQVETKDKNISTSPFYLTYDMVFTCLMLLLVNVGTHFLGAKVPALRENMMLPYIMTIAAGYSVYSLANVQYRTAKDDFRQVTVVLGVFGALLALVLLVLFPRWILDFQLEAAAAALGAMRADFAQRVAERLGQKESFVGADTEVDPLFLALGLAGLAGMQCSCMFEAAVRVARSSHLILNPGTKEMQETMYPSSISLMAQKAGVGLSLSIPALAILLWIQPLTDFVEELTPVSRTTWTIVRSCSLLLVGAVQAVLLRPIVQAFLHSAYVYHQTVINDTSEKVTPAERAQLIRLECGRIMDLQVKVAVQALAAAMLFVACGAMMIVYATPFGPECSQSFSTLLGALAGFFGWWGAFSWFLTTTIIMSLFRFGAMAN